MSYVDLAALVVASLALAALLTFSNRARIVIKEVFTPGRLGTHPDVAPKNPSTPEPRK